MKYYTKKTIEFYNKNVDAYTKSGAVVLKNKIDKFIKLLCGKKILDVACGPGHDTDYFAKKGFDCLGIDLSEKMIASAKKNFQGKFRIMDFFDMEFKENSFDGIWCSAAIVHTDKNDLDKLLEDFGKILGQNGVLGIIAHAKQKRTKKKGDSRIFTVFDKDELGKHLKNNGFEVVHSKSFSYKKKRWLFIISKKIG